VLADGIVTEEERTHLLSVLTEMANADFAATGSASAEPMQLPVDESRAVNWNNAGVVHTGAFLFGTRAQCERLSMTLGAMPLDNVSKQTDVLVIGTRISPAWVNESYGRKIMKAAQLRKDGHPIHIVTEKFWFGHAQSIGKA
jgi:NAD-dependent DNA ligase